MIYTVGNKANYLKTISEAGVIRKVGRREVGDPHLPNGYNGGCAFRTAEDAQRFIDEQEKSEVWGVFGLLANWGTDTVPNADGGWWHDLIHDAEIVLLEGV
jgi:hypothetical protein